MRAPEAPGSARLFIALWPDAGTRSRLVAVQRTLGRAGRPVDAGNLHLTLAFLGATPRSAIPQLTQLLAEARPAACDLVLDRLGVFDRARVMWLGCKRVPAPLVAYHLQISRDLKAAGFRVEARAFAPHVTLFRKAARMPAAVPPFAPVIWLVREFALVESASSPAGVLYRVVASIKV